MMRLTILAGVASALMLSSAQADGTRNTSCVFSRGTASCVTNWQRWERQAPRVATEQEIAEIRERERLWQAHCRPAIRPDEFGVRRYVYAASGCEFGKFE